MTKKELIDETTKELCQTRCITSTEVREVLECAIAVITDAIATGEEITIRGLGTLKIIKQKAKKAQDISRGKTIDLPERNKVKFFPAQSLKNRINER